MKVYSESDYLLIQTEPAALIERVFIKGKTKKKTFAGLQKMR
jgi:hypothetical protein